MGEYRLVVADGSVLSTFTAEGDEAAVALARARSSRRAVRELFFTVQRATDGDWVDLATWVPRPLGRQQLLAPAAGATSPRRAGSRHEPAGQVPTYCCDAGAAVYPLACPQHGRQVPPDLVDEASAED